MRFALIFALALAAPLAGQRITVPLDGQWNIDESVSPDEMPASFRHTVPVPGMANLAAPPFPDVDLFDSREIINNRVRKGVLPESAIVTNAGISRQKRNYFWYEKRFRVPARKEVAILKINKAQFGTAVWLNGRKAGEHLSCFTAGYFNVTDAVDWSGENRLVVRIGAHPGVLPEGVPAGTDFEKLKWTPGIYDSVSLLLGDNPIIETVQVAPRIKSSEIVVEIKLRNYGAARAAELRHTVKAWKGGQQAAAAAPERIELKAGEERTVRQTIRIPNARPWSPEEPFLYVLESATGGDSSSTRFGMREFLFDTATRRAWLNGKVYFLRGSNVTLHRFFEDPGCKRLPWTEAWVQKLLAEIPKKMNWNSFRFCIGPVPDRWLEIADEAGLLIQNEYFIWTGHPEWRGVYSRKWNGDFLVEEYKRWMRDNWNHPSVAIWDANNESFDPIFADKVIPAVRGLDLSGRPWENSYNIPVGPDDPVEHHPYLFSRTENDSDRPFRMAELEEMGGAPRGAGNIPSGHAAVVNEYGWIWLNRDGTPTELTKKVYADLTGPNATAEERFAMNGYLLGGLTEYWRAFRHYAGVLHFVYLTCSYPGVYTSDHFRNLETLEIDPYFADYVGEAFKPLGVYIHFWQPELKAGAERTFPVMMVNDGAQPVNGRLVLSLEAEGGGEAARAETAFKLMANGQETYLVKLRVPAVSGRHVLKASADPGSGGPTVSRRKVTVQ